ncbi:MAG: GNAT family N-acetyltransferase [Proteobacteria bacterium]|nr:GNAT family N-acetyltransferase [Pseudomonadota bacterium]
MAVDKVKKLSKRDLTELTDASEAAIRDGSGFGWVEVPPRAVLERYWRGVLVVPTRSLFLARFENVVCGSVQLVEPPKNKEVWSFAATIDTHFVAPWARGHGLAHDLVDAAEAEAVTQGYQVLNLSVTATQTQAIQLYEGIGYMRWGTLPRYALVKGKFVPGHFYTKDL